jgi:excinuclease ABC subunit C
MNEKLEIKLNNLPDKSGIYQFKNDKGKVIYVGKALNLRNRVRSYFQKNLSSPKTLALVNKCSDLELIITDNEIEALVLENNLIKELKPRYNILLKDDKSFPFIKISNEPFPRIYPTRNRINDGSKYFGPYTDVKNMKSSLRMINQIFRIRSCKLNLTIENIQNKKFKVCLDYHIKKCDGPCEALIGENEYRQMVGQVSKMLGGKLNDLLAELNSKMKSHVEMLEFEKAAMIRDRINQLNSLGEKQKIFNDDFDSRDVIASAWEGKDATCSIFNIRDGRLIGKKQLRLSIEEVENSGDIYSAILKQYYNEVIEIPKEIIIETEPTDSEIIKEWLSGISKQNVKFIIPKNESKSKSILKMCKENAKLQLMDIQTQRMKKEGNVPYTLAALQRDLKLKHLPKKIECFDISNIQGTDTVASMVVFIDGKPKKSLYRKYIIKDVSGANDFASMEEVISRRYQRSLNENESFPDLVMIDGGKGQLSASIYALNKLGIKEQPIISLAKRLEEIYMPNQKDAVIIPKTSSSLKLLQQIRDEAHRFAVTFHRLRRDKRTLTSELMNINGIGKKLSDKLLKELGSIDKIKNAGLDVLEKIVSEKKAKLIYSYFNN